MIYLAYTKDTMNLAVQVAEAYRRDEVAKPVYEKLKQFMNLMPERIRKIYLEYGIKFSSFDEAHAFFYGVSHDTISELFGD